MGLRPLSTRNLNFWGGFRKEGRKNTAYGGLLMTLSYYPRGKVASSSPPPLLLFSSSSSSLSFPSQVKSIITIPPKYIELDAKQGPSSQPLLSHAARGGAAHRGAIQGPGRRALCLSSPFSIHFTVSNIFTIFTYTPYDATPALPQAPAPVTRWAPHRTVRGPRP